MQFLCVKIFGYLKKFVKESELKTRERFLRFCTGANLVINDIKITFNSLSGLRRVPVAHTCTGILELSDTYESYLAFRSEFNQILDSKIWVMDII